MIIVIGNVIVVYMKLLKKEKVRKKDIMQEKKVDIHLFFVLFVVLNNIQKLHQDVIVKV